MCKFAIGEHRGPFILNVVDTALSVLSIVRFRSIRLFLFLVGKFIIAFKSMKNEENCSYLK